MSDRNNAIAGLHYGGGIVFEDSHKKHIGLVRLICTSRASDKYKFGVLEIKHRAATIIVTMTPTKIEVSRKEHRGAK